MRKGIKTKRKDVLVNGKQVYYNIPLTDDNQKQFIGLRTLSNNPIKSPSETIREGTKQGAEALKKFEPIKDIRLDTNVVSTIYQDPYSYDFKIRLGNAFTFDSVIQQGILTRMQYVIGNGWSYRLIPKRDVRNLQEAEVQQIINDIIPERDQQFIEDVVYTLEDEDVCNIKLNSERLFVQGLVGGRSACLKQYLTNDNPFTSIVDNRKFPGIEHLKDEEINIGLPGALINLNYAKLGQVFVHPNSLQIEMVRYNDNIRKSDVDKPDKKPYTDFLIDDLIYAVYGDYGIPPNSQTPDTLNYGASALPPILGLSESNRRLNEVVFPQINESMWSGSGIFKVKDSSALEDSGGIVNKIEAGRYMAYIGAEMEFQKLELDPKIMELIEQRKQNNLVMLMQVRVPSPFMNQENITNRATIEDVGWIWQRTTLEGDREWFRRVMQKYWLQPIMQVALELKSVHLLKAKLVQEFNSVIFDAPKSKAELTKILMELGVIDIVEAREMNGLPPLKQEIIGTNENLEETIAQQDDINTRRVEESNRNVDGEITPRDMQEVDGILS